ncbi:acetoacetate decarboxylase (ADC) [Cupriavidus basilensis]|uniref:acetoacetate decarboxylase (ADC) n=1 Tax=Cupriavidus basilensis TaxID=68895 RepID=UPI0020A641BA|nr:acetoacetate decarboxylase (ADC) [Cupriavidus basilensis]MCP3020416.1 acetoacetate decarboxylase (ADC) [Cupriavidus basilensis]
MKISNLAAAGVIMSVFLNPAWADGTSETRQTESTTISIAGHEVPVVKGGLYDRYRSNPPLFVIASEAPDVDLSWFKELKKERVNIGFESHSPNFYYKNSRVTVIFTADLNKLRELMPAQVLEKVQPLQVWPGRGLVALTAYAYDYCDNDSYNEIGLSVITNRPGSANLGPLTLMSQAMSNDFWGYVLKLPVNTELARVRGVVGYNLPKWLTGINYRETDKSVVVEIFDSETGKVDVTIEARKLDDLSKKISMVTNSFTNVDQQGRLTTGYATSRQLSHASSTSAEAVSLSLTEGSLSTFIKSLKLGKMLKYEYVPEFQSALYSPKPL